MTSHRVLTLQSASFVNHTAGFFFDLGPLNEAGVRSIFPQGVNASYTIGLERVLQNYLAAFDHQIICELVPLFFKPPKKKRAQTGTQRGGAIIRFDEIRFRPADDAKASVAWRQTHRVSDRARTGFGSIGRVVIDTSDLLSHVSRSLKNGRFDEEGLSIKATSETVWSELSRNMRGVLHTWLQKGVFRPKTYATKPSREGCLLDRSDQVVIGLLYGLFSFGTKHAAFSVPVKPIEV